MNSSSGLKSKILTLIHHFITGFGMIGWKYSSGLHFIFMVAVVISWVINDDQCIITQLHNTNGSKLHHTNKYFKSLGIQLDEEESSFINYVFAVYVAMLSLMKI